MLAVGSISQGQSLQSRESSKFRHTCQCRVSLRMWAEEPWTGCTGHRAGRTVLENAACYLLWSSYQVAFSQSVETRTPESPLPLPPLSHFHSFRTGVPPSSLRLDSTAVRALQIAQPDSKPVSKPSLSAAFYFPSSPFPFPFSPSPALDRPWL